MGYFALALSRTPQGIPGYCCLPAPKHPARKGSPGLHGNQCDFCFGQMQSVGMEQVEQAANTGYLDCTKGFVVCHVDQAVRRFRYTWQFSHICLINFFFKSVGLWAGTDLSVLRFFFFFFLVSKWKLCRQLQIFQKNISKTFLEGHFKSLTTGSGQHLCVNPTGPLCFLS